MAGGFVLAAGIGYMIYSKVKKKTKGGESGSADTAGGGKGEGMVQTNTSGTGRGSAFAKQVFAPVPTSNGRVVTGPVTAPIVNKANIAQTAIQPQTTTPTPTAAAPVKTSMPTETVAPIKTASQTPLKSTTTKAPAPTGKMLTTQF